VTWHALTVLTGDLTFQNVGEATVPSGGGSFTWSMDFGSLEGLEGQIILNNLESSKVNITMDYLECWRASGDDSKAPFGVLMSLDSTTRPESVSLSMGSSSYGVAALGIIEFANAGIIDMAQMRLTTLSSLMLDTVTYTNFGAMLPKLSTITNTLSMDSTTDADNTDVDWFSGLKFVGNIVLKSNSVAINLPSLIKVDAQPASNGIEPNELTIDSNTAAITLGSESGSATGTVTCYCYSDSGSCSSGAPGWVTDEVNALCSNSFTPDLTPYCELDDGYTDWSAFAKALALIIIIIIIISCCCFFGIIFAVMWCCGMSVMVCCNIGKNKPNPAQINVNTPQGSTVVTASPMQVQPQGQGNNNDLYARRVAAANATNANAPMATVTAGEHVSPPMPDGGNPYPNPNAGATAPPPPSYADATMSVQMA
jgi:hypothetical protein